MAQLILESSISTDNLLAILDSGYSEYGFKNVTILKEYGVFLRGECYNNRITVNLKGKEIYIYTNYSFSEVIEGLLLWFSVILIPVFFINMHKREKIPNEIANYINLKLVETNKKSTNFPTPDICPTCKNPNTQKERICEWCGSKFI